MSTTEDTTKPKRTPRKTAEKRKPLPRIENVRQIVDAEDRPEKEVDVPEWGGSLLMRGMALGALDELQTRYANGGYAYLLEMVALTIVEPEITVEQATLFSEKSADVMGRVIAEALGLNGLGEALERALVEQFPDGRAQANGVPAGSGAEDAGGGAA